MANQLRKTRERVEVIWGHVLTEDNPTHRASRNKLVSIENQLVGRNQSGLVTQEMAKKPCHPTQ